ncbi:MAG: hypothetical protein NTZ05_15405 [Chloroflexi bacterium]|nr:hypothetical protein [Chloroflexota bacterium]
MTTHHVTQPGDQGAQWSEDALPEGVGGNMAGGGAAPVLQAGAQTAESDGHGGGGSLTLLAALAALAAPVLWAIGYGILGAPAVGVWRFAAVLLLGLGSVAMYWLVRRST